MHGASILSTIVGLPQWILSGFEQQPAIPVLSQKTWAEFNSSVSGRLHLSTADSGPCAIAASSLANLRFNGTGAELTPWEQCQNTASKGGSNAYYVDAHSTADVANAFRFVNQTGVPLILNNLETEFCSSPLPNSLTVLTDSMNKVAYERSFRPLQCNSITSTPAITFAPGASLKSIYSLAEEKGVTVVGPSGTTSVVGNSFFTDATSVLAPAFGSVLDNVLEIEVVTPDGKVRVANPCLEPDLWFALRGGGSNTFGAVTKVTVKAHPRTTLAVLAVTVKPSQINTRRVLSTMSESAIQWAKAGWGGYITASQIVLVNPGLNGNVANAMDSLFALKSLLQSMDAEGQVVAEQWSSFLSYDEWLESAEYKVVEALVEPLKSPNYAISSRLVTDTLFDDAYGKQDLVKALVTPIQQVDSWLVSLNLPYGFTDVRTSFTPAFYKSPWTVYFFGALNPLGGKEERLLKHSAVAKADNFLRYLTPGSGVYSEHADLSEPNHEDAFWGGNYASLLKIKRKCDPRNILHTWRSIGWRGASSDPRFACYTPAKLQEVRCDRHCR